MGRGIRLHWEQATYQQWGKWNISPGPDVGLWEQPVWSYLRFHAWLEEVATDGQGLRKAL